MANQYSPDARFQHHPGRAAAGGQRQLLGGLLLLCCAATLFLIQSGTAAARSPGLRTGQATVKEPPAAVSAAALHGAHRVFDKGYPSYIQLSPGHTFTRSSSLANLESAPIDWGTWHMRGNTLVLISATEVTNCGPGRNGWYTISAYERGGFHFLRRDDLCAARRDGFVPTPDAHPLQNQGLLCRTDGPGICE